MFSWFSSSSSKESELINNIQNLETSNPEWSSVIREFMDTQLTDDYQQIKIDIKALNVLCNFLRHSDETNNKDGVLLRILVFKAIQKLLVNKFLFSQISKYFQLDLFIKEVAKSSRQSLPYGINSLHAIIYLETKDDVSEEENKFMFSKVNGFEFLLYILQTYSTDDSDADVIESVLEILKVFLITRRQNSAMECIKKLQTVFLPEIQIIMDLLHHSDEKVRSSSSLIIKQILKESPPNIIQYIQLNALESGVLLHQLLFILNDETTSNDAQREISIELIGLFCTGCHQSLLVIQNIFPEILIQFLKPDQSSKNLNWNRMFTKVMEDFEEPKVIWDKKTRNELKQVLEEEISILETQIDRNDWDYENFSVVYKSPKDFFVIPYYLNLLEETIKKSKDFKIDDPVTFVRNLYDSLVVSKQDEIEIILRTMKNVINRYLDSFQKFEHMHYLVWLMDIQRSNDKWLEELFLLIKKLFTYTFNIKLFVEAGGIPLLVDHLCVLHTNANKIERNTESPNIFTITVNALALIEAISVIPRYRRALSTKDNLQYIIQTLLVNQREIINQVVVILLTLTSHFQEIQPVLYETGVFLFLMRLMNTGCTELMALFLRKYHRVQDYSENEKNSSFLQNFLPASLYLLLDKDKGEMLFSEAMNTNSCGPYLIWSKDQRTKMVNEIDLYLNDFQLKLPKNPKIYYKFETPFKINYESDEEIFIENIYVRLHNEYPDSDIIEPEKYLFGLIDNMKEDSKLITITTAQSNLYKKYSKLEVFTNYPAFDKLNLLLDRYSDVQNEQNIEVLESLTNLLSVIFSSENSSENRIGFIQKQEYVEKLFEFLKKCSNELNAFQRIIFNVLNIINLLSTNLVDYFANQPKLFQTLTKYYTSLKNHSKISLESIKIINNLSKFESLHEKMIENGVLLHLLDIGVLYQNEEKNGIDEILFISVVSLINLSKNFEVHTLLINCLTDNLLNLMIESPSEFVFHSRKTIENPKIIWNHLTQKELKEFVKSEIPKVTQDGEWKIPTFRYSCLEDELMIDGVYISGIKMGSQFELENPGKFLEHILLSISEDNLGLSKPDNDEKIVQVILKKLCMKLTALKSLLKEQKDNLHLSESNYLNLTPLFNILLELPKLENNRGSFKLLLESFLLLSNDGYTWKHTSSLFCFHKLLHISNEHKEIILKILSEICLNENKAVDNAITSGVIITALYIISSEENEEIRLEASKLLGVIVGNLKFGEFGLHILQKVMMQRFGEYLLKSSEIPESLLDFYDDDHNAPDIVWNDGVRGDLQNYLKSQIDLMNAYFEKFNKEYTYLYEPYERKSLKKEILVGDIFIKSFNDNPYFKVNNPDRLLSLLFARLSDEHSEYLKSVDYSTTPLDLCSLWDAIKNLIKNSQSLQLECNKYIRIVFAFLQDYEEEDTNVINSVLNVLAILVQNETSVNHVVQGKYLPILLFLTNIDDLCLSILNVFVEMTKFPEFLLQFKLAGGIVYVLKLILRQENKVREKSAELLSKITLNSKYGSQMKEYICQFLTPKFSSKFESRPDKFIEFFDGFHETTGKYKRKWSKEIREDLLLFLEERIKEFEAEKWNGSERFSIDSVSQIFKKE
eukprot:gene7646-11968_t